MVPIISLFTFQTIVCLFLGLYVLTLSPQNKINQLFVLISLTLIIMSFTNIMAQSTSSKTIVQIWFKIGSTGFVSYIYFVLLFCLRLTNLFNIKKIYYIIPIFPLLYIIFRFIFTPQLGIFERYNNIWILVSFPNKYISLLYLTVSYEFLYLMACITLLIIWYKRSKSIRQKCQALIILITLFPSIFFALFDHLVLFHLLHILNSRTPGIISIYLLFWVFGIWYAIVRYRFLSITPATVSNDIIENVDESIILLDNEHRIITANKRTKALTNNNKLEGKNLSKVILEYNEVSKEIAVMLGGKTKDFSCRLNYLNIENKKVLMDTKFSLIKDRFDDNIGIMIIGHEVKEIKQLMTIYKITEREAEIIQDIITGYTNIEIAKYLGITENTIKKHITTIYNKLGVDNKIQLINLLKDFNLIPEQKAEKTVFLLRKSNNDKLND